MSAAEIEKLRVSTNHATSPTIESFLATVKSLTRERDEARRERDIARGAAHINYSAIAGAYREAAEIEFDEPTGCSTSVRSSLSEAAKHAIRGKTPATAIHAEKLLVDAATESGRNDMLRWITASLISYPNGGADIGVMKEVDRLVAQAVKPLKEALEYVLQREKDGYLSFCGMPNTKKVITAALEAIQKEAGNE